MEYHAKYITPEIKLSSFSDRLARTELLFENHMLIWFISGETRIIMADQQFDFGEGDIFLIPRNQIVSVVNHAKDDKPHQSVVMNLTVNRLKKFYEKIELNHLHSPAEKVIYFTEHPLLKSCLASLLPYFDMTDSFPEEIADLKITEAITILRKVHPEIDGTLANFAEPGKIDLSDFMEKHYMFNMPLEKFGYLTGRSLSTFHRDFKKHYQLSPQKWLTQKRLALAHHQILDRKRKPADVYLEAGFEDLSHFSFVFKKQFGYTPGTLLKTTGSSEE